MAIEVIRPYLVQLEEDGVYSFALYLAGRDAIS
jgi:hypothetical protein